MNAPLRAVLSLACGAAAFYFAYWTGGALVYSLGLPTLLSTLVALLVAFLVGRYVWLHGSEPRPGLLRSAGVGAIATGGIGFLAGFFGPLIFTPGANQGPLLGIFITGPLGFVLGGIGGAVYWFRRRGRGAGE